MSHLRGIALMFLIMALVALAIVYTPKFREQKQKATRMSALLQTADFRLHLGSRVKGAKCVRHGSFPDSACTPGAVFSDARPEKICVKGYTQTVRNVPFSLRKMVFAEYGIKYPQSAGILEVDHLVPLALGGNNEIANLFPESAEPAPGFHEKDIVEVYLQAEVCSGRVKLKAAQTQIANDWVSVYKNLTDDQIQRIKSKYSGTQY